MAATREQIMTALFSLLRGSSTFLLTGRRLKHWSECEGRMPALFLLDADEEWKTSRGLPPKITLSAEIWVYTDDGKDPNVAPSIGLNNVIDAIQAVMTPSGRDLAMGNVLTLGGLVSHCWIEGKPIKDPGYLGPVAKAVIPVSILVNS